MISYNSTIAITGASDSIRKNNLPSLEVCRKVLEEAGLKVIVMPSVISDENDKTQDPRKRAKDIEEAFTNPEVEAIFDITGGDSANGTLEYLDLNLIQNHSKPFIAYSDNSVIINPLLERGIPCYYYQLLNIARNTETREEFLKMINGYKTIYTFKPRMLQGLKLKGYGTRGGNIRCTLKLMGTPFMPNFKNKVLFLESMSGSLERIETYLRQYKMAGIFTDASSLILGNFSELQTKNQMQDLYDLVLKIIDNTSFPIAVTEEIGHQSSSKCLDYSLIY